MKHRSHVASIIFIVLWNMKIRKEKDRFLWVMCRMPVFLLLFSLFYLLLPSVKEA